MDPHLFHCPICFEDFDLSERVPRILLLCGHTICTRCLNLILRGKPVCPLDNKEMPGTQVQNFPINYVLKSILELRLQENFCPVHREAITFICLDDKQKLCNDCLEKHMVQRHQIRNINSIKKQIETHKQLIKELRGDIEIYRKKIDETFEEKRPETINMIRIKFQEIRSYLAEKEDELIFMANSFFDVAKNKLENLLGLNSSLIMKLYNLEEEIENSYKSEKIFLGDSFFSSIQKDIQDYENKVGPSTFTSLQQTILEEFQKMSQIFNSAFPDIKPLLSQVELPFWNPLDKLLSDLGDDKEKKYDSIKVKSRFVLNQIGNSLDISNGYDKLSEIELNLQKWIKIEKVSLYLVQYPNNEDLQALKHFWSRLKSPSIVNIKLNPGTVSDEAYQILVEGPNNFSSIEIDITDYPITNDSKVLLLIQKLLSKAKNIKKVALRLWRVQLPPRSIDLIFRTNILEEPTLEEFYLNLKKVNVSDEDLRPIFVPMPNVKKFALFLSNTYVTDRSVELLTRSTLATMKSLVDVTVFFYGTKVTDNGAQHLLHQIKNATEISLDFGLTKITDKTPLLLARLIGNRFTMLTKFEMAFGATQVTDDGLMSLFVAMPLVRSFFLGLELNNITDRSIKKFAKETLPTMRALESFTMWLNGTKITDESIALISQNIGDVKQFIFYLDSTVVCDESIQPLVREKLAKMTKLTKLDVRVFETKVTKPLQEEINALIKKVNTPK